MSDVEDSFCQRCLIGLDAMRRILAVSLHSILINSLSPVCAHTLSSVVWQGLGRQVSD